MKKLLTLVLALLLTTAAYAEPIFVEDVLESIPALDNGVVWDFDQKGLSYTSTLDILDWKGFTLNAGYARTFDNDNEESADSMIAGLSYEIANLEKLGVSVPILKYVKIEPMVYIGWQGINVQVMKESEFVWGAGAKILEIAF